MKQPLCHRLTEADLIAFEKRIVSRFQAGELPFLVHLSGGNERILLDLFRSIHPGDWVLSTHRNHYHALLAGMEAEAVEDAIRDGRSMFMFSKEHRFLSSSILAGTCAIAAGLALGEKHTNPTRPSSVWCFIGDGAEDNGHFYEAVRFVTGHDLPCIFVIEDNDRQVDTSHAERWGTDERWPWHTPHVIRYHYRPTFPHGGAGLKPGSITFQPDVVAKYVPNVDSEPRGPKLSNT